MEFREGFSVMILTAKGIAIFNTYHGEYGSTPYICRDGTGGKWLPHVPCTKSHVQNSALDVLVLGDCIPKHINWYTHILQSIKDNT